MLQAELRKTLFLLKSYPLQMVADQLFLLFTFLLVTGVFELLTGGNYSREEQLSSLVGFLIWRVSAGILAEIVYSVAKDAEWGTLEQIHLGKHSLFTILATRATSQLIYYSGRILILALILILVFKLPFIFSISALVVYCLTFISMFDLSLVLAGLQLKYKNIEALVFALGTVLLFLTGAMSNLQGVPILFEISRFLPLSIGIDLFRQMVIDGRPLAIVLTQPDFFWFCLNTAIYLVVGSLVLNWGRQCAFHEGSLSHY